MGASVKNLNKEENILLSNDFCSLKEYWEAKSNKKFEKCANFICSNPAEVGGYVALHNEQDAQEYVVPVCQKCNQKPSDECYFVVTEFVEIGSE